MSVLRAVTILPYTTGIPRDVATNTTYWSVPDPFTNDHVFEIEARLIAAYQGFQGWISGIVSRTANACTVELYNMGDPAPRLPIDTAGFTLGPVGEGALSLPLEVALVLSYRALYASGVPNARRRGRMYLGPIATPSETPIRPDSSIINAAVAFGETLWTPIEEADVIWVQRSETTGQANVAVAGWVDNEWDTQRRRGRGATSRTPLGAPPT